MKETPSASAKCISMLIEQFDERTGKRVAELLDRLYAKGYTQDDICDVLRMELEHSK